MPPQVRRHIVELLVAGSAVVISLASLLIAKRQSDVMDRQLEASVWPYLQLDNSDYDVERQAPTIILGVRNVGVGPARVRSIRVTMDDRPVGNARELLERCCGMRVERDRASLQLLTSGLSGTVLAVDQRVRFFQLTRTPETNAIWFALDSARFRLRVRVCYCSVLGRCWIARNGTDDALSVDDCEAERKARQFEG